MCLNGFCSHWRPARSLSVGAALVAVGFGALAVCTHYWGIVATVVVWTFGEMILFPASAAYVSELAPRSRRGEYMGFYSMSFGLGFALGPWLGLATYESPGRRGSTGLSRRGCGEHRAPLRVRSDSPRRRSTLRCRTRSGLS